MSQSLPKTINLGRKVYQLLTITKNMFEKKKLKGTYNLWKGKFENLGQFLDWKENCRCPQHVLIKNDRAKESC